MKVADNKQTPEQLTFDADLQRQRNYIKELEDMQFDYGLVLGNAFVKGMRDIGYKSTAYALNELNDNAIQAGARKLHVAFGYDAGSKKKPTSLAIIDDGHGMDPTMIRASVVWGGTHRHNDRAGWGRYGYGLPSACVSMGKRYTVYSKTEGAKWFRVTVDLDDIDNHFRMRAAGPVTAEVPVEAEPPKWVAEYMLQHFKDHRSGTIVLIEKVDRLDFWTTDKLRADLLQDFGTTYRNFLNAVSMSVDGVAVEATDPLFLTEGFRFYGADSDRAEAFPPAEIVVNDKETKEPLGSIKVRFSYMPPTFLRVQEDKLKPKGGKSNQRFPIRKANNGIIVLRAGRQIDVVNAKCPWTTFQNNDRYVGIEVDFPPSLDEEFSITTAKQQVLIKPRIWDILEEHGVLRAINAMRLRYEKESKTVIVKAGEGQEKRPSEAAIEAAHEKFAQPPSEPSPEQRKKSEENIEREAEKLAEHAGVPKPEARKMLEAKAKTSPFKVEFVDMPGAPFYRMEQRGAQRVLIINKGHKFYTDLYASHHATPHVRYALEALLFVMGDCELRANEPRQAFYEQERQAWSVNLNTTLRALEDWDTSSDMSSSDAESAEAAESEKERNSRTEVVST